jgi:hypothetical protein
LDFSVHNHLLVRRAAEQELPDLFQDFAIFSTGRRNRGEFGEEAYGTIKEFLEAVFINKPAQVMGAPCSEQD